MWQIETWGEADNDNGIRVLWKRSGYGHESRGEDLIKWRLPTHRPLSNWRQELCGIIAEGVKWTGVECNVGAGDPATEADVHHWQMPKIANYSQKHRACVGSCRRDWNRFRIIRLPTDARQLVAQKLIEYFWKFSETTEICKYVARLPTLGFSFLH